MLKPKEWLPLCKSVECEISGQVLFIVKIRPRFVGSGGVRLIDKDNGLFIAAGTIRRSFKYLIL